MGVKMACGQMSKKNFDAFLKSVEEMGAIRRGEKTPTRVTYRPAPVKAEEIKKLRKQLNITQAGLAKIVGEGEGAVQSWEQGQRNAGGAATKIIRLLEEMPELKDRLMTI